MTDSIQSADSSKRVLLAGGGGMLGLALARELGRRGLEVVSASRTKGDLVLDITDPESCVRAMGSVRPAIVINAAAQANVDCCEEHPREAFAANAEGPANLARAARQAGAKLIHFSTDYVFDGRGDRPFTEDDATVPINVYGRSKLEGERAVLAAGGDFAVLRICALFGAGGRNFVDTMAGKILAGEKLRVVNDQITRPTATADLAEALGRALEGGADGLRGVFHVAAEGFCSWYDFACAICGCLGRDAAEAVSPVTSAEFPRPARRPAFAVFDTSKFSKTFGFALPGWREGLDKYLDKNCPKC